MANKTISEIIAILDDTVTNDYSTEDKVRWLSDLDARIKTNIINRHIGGENIAFDGYTADNLEAELLVPPEYDEVYLLWLESKINFSNKEYSRYNNSITTFNSVYNDFSNYYTRTHTPKQTKLKGF